MVELKFTDADLRKAVTRLLTDEECQQMRDEISTKVDEAFYTLAMDAYRDLGLFHYDILA